VLLGNTPPNYTRAMSAKAGRQISLVFAPPTAPEGKKATKFRDSLSAVELVDGGNTLFVGVDETVDTTPTIERLTWTGDGYAAHQALPVDELLTLADSTPKKGRVGEIDIEGLAVCDSFLWVVGSHSSARKKPKHRSLEEDFERLATVKLSPNRVLLGRIPLVSSADGSTLAKQDGSRRSARLVEDIRERLCDDPLLGPFVGAYKNADGEPLTIPGKDNGFDIEGIVVASGAGGSSRVLLGLRGPVLRGWATILEIAPVEGNKPNQLELGPVDPSSKKRYRKHLLHLDGLGIRDLRADGDDILVLAGPTMTLDGEIALYRWIGGLLPASGDTLTDLAPGQLEHVLTLPRGRGEDRPEGFARLPSGELLVVYDSPADARLTGEHGVLADVFPFPVP
jgi:hypothetical protein